MTRTFTWMALTYLTPYGKKTRDRHPYRFHDDSHSHAAPRPCNSPSAQSVTISKAVYS